jgi:hypothetical protein
MPGSNLWSLQKQKSKIKDSLKEEKRKIAEDGKYISAKTKAGRNWAQP